MTVEQLMARYGTYVHARVVRIVGIDDAEDVCQLVWLSVWRKFESFRGDAQVSSWLYRVATNHALTHLRARKRRPQSSAVPIPDSEESQVLVDAQFLDGAANPERRCLATRELRAVCARLGRLNHDQRQALAGVLAGETIPQIAARVRVPASTMKTRVWRARRSLGRRAA